MTNPDRSRSSVQLGEESSRWMQRFQALFMTTAMTVFEQDRSLRYTWIRDPYAIFDVENTLGKTDDELFPPREVTALARMKHLVIERGIGASAVFRLTGPQKIVTVEMLIGPLVNNRGEIIGITGTLRDISDAADGDGIDTSSAAELSESQLDHQRYLGYLSRSLTDIRDDERSRLTHELHDLLGPILTALGMELHTLSLLIGAQTTDQKVLALLDDARTLADELGELVRNFMLEIQPALLDGFGLTSYLLTYKTAFAQRVGIKVAVEEDSFPTLPSDVEYALFRIIREALNNAAKHARADHITISLTTDGDRVRVIVTDNGCGFDVEERNPEGVIQNWGLTLMKERADAIGGRLGIESTLGEGTSVSVELQQ